MSNNIILPNVDVISYPCPKRLRSTQLPDPNLVIIVPADVLAISRYSIYNKRMIV